jgi:hypothetical protein
MVLYALGSNQSRVHPSRTTRQAVQTGRPGLGIQVAPPNCLSHVPWNGWMVAAFSTVDGNEQVEPAQQ